MKTLLDEIPVDKVSEDFSPSFSESNSADDGDGDDIDTNTAESIEDKLPQEDDVNKDILPETYGGYNVGF